MHPRKTAWFPMKKPNTIKICKAILELQEPLPIAVDPFNIEPVGTVHHRIYKKKKRSAAIAEIEYNRIENSAG